jgi:hypothetical protein
MFSISRDGLIIEEIDDKSSIPKFGILEEIKEEEKKGDEMEFDKYDTLKGRAPSASLNRRKSTQFRRIS